MEGGADASQRIRAWLIADRSGDALYRRLRLVESQPDRQSGLATLQELVAEAHKDTAEHIARLTNISLDPLGGSSAVDALAYPEGLHTFTLQGYLGEIMAGVVAETFEPHDVSWEVPAYLFRFHGVALQILERRRQLGGPATHVPGRTGDDCVAFVRDDDGLIVGWLMCEAKCSHDHHSSMISEGHEQLSGGEHIPVDLVRLIEILHDSQRPDKEDWIAALRLLYTEQHGVLERYDMLVYVCGRQPVVNDGWLDASTPHAKYTGERKLEAVEIHIMQFDDVLTSVYPGHQIQRG